MADALAVPVFDKAVKLLFVVARDTDCAPVLAGAKAVAETAGAEAEVIDLPRALELPSLIAMAERQARYDGYVAIGFSAQAAEIGRTLAFVGLQGAAIGNAVYDDLGAANDEAGRTACLAALHLIGISRNWAGQTKGIGFRP